MCFKPPQAYFFLIFDSLIISGWNTESISLLRRWPGVQKPIDQYGPEGVATGGAKAAEAAAGGDEDEDDDFDLFGDDDEDEVSFLHLYEQEWGWGLECCLVAQYVENSPT